MPSRHPRSFDRDDQGRRMLRRTPRVTPVRAE
jgi:hypothetical protein